MGGWRIERLGRMCGTVPDVGKRPLEALRVEALKRLEYRSNDSPNPLNVATVEFLQGSRAEARGHRAGFPFPLKEPPRRGRSAHLLCVGDPARTVWRTDRRHG